MSDAYLEHFGVKGMRWGVRRQRTPEEQQHDAKVQRVKTGLKVAAVVGVTAVGAAGVGYVLGKSKGKKAALIKADRRAKYGNKLVSNYMDKFGKKKVSELKKQKSNPFRDILKESMNKQEQDITVDGPGYKVSGNKKAVVNFMKVKLEDHYQRGEIM